MALTSVCRWQKIKSYEWKVLQSSWWLCGIIVGKSWLHIAREMAVCCNPHSLSNWDSCITRQWGYKHTFCQSVVSANKLLVHMFSYEHTYLLTYLLTYLFTYLLTYLLSPWSRVHLEKLTGSQLVKKFPAFYGTQRFITAVTSAHHLSLSLASLIQSIPPHPTSWRSILILSSHLCLGPISGLLPSGFPTKTLYTRLLSPVRATCPAHLILDFITRTVLGEEYRSLSSSLCHFFHSPVTSSLLGPNILLNTQFSNTLSLCSSLNVSDLVPYSKLLFHERHDKFSASRQSMPCT